MNERTIRFGFSGVTFILSLIFFYWWVGGSLLCILPMKDQQNWLNIAISVISTPVIGFILSSIGTSVVRQCLPNRIEFREPSEPIRPMYYREIVSYSRIKLPGINPSGNEYILEGKGKTRRSNVRRIYLVHASLFIKKATDEAIKFSSRRIDVYYMHVSLISSIVIAFFVSIVIAWQNNVFSKATFDCRKLTWILFFIVYFVIGFCQAKKNLIEGNELEKIYLINN
jgi:phosphate/sulfate permease